VYGNDDGGSEDEEPAPAGYGCNEMVEIVGCVVAGADCGGIRVVPVTSRPRLPLTLFLQPPASHITSIGGARNWSSDGRFETRSTKNLN